MNTMNIEQQEAFWNGLTDEQRAAAVECVLARIALRLTPRKTPENGTMLQDALVGGDLYFVIAPFWDPGGLVEVDGVTILKERQTVEA